MLNPQFFVQDVDQTALGDVADPLGHVCHQDLVDYVEEGAVVDGN